MLKAAVGCLAVLFAGAPNASSQTCAPKGVALQILGSGGPLAGGRRASTSYLVWVDGHARVLVDAGGGSFVRFGEARARVEDLALVAITHFHPDHVSDLPALLWLSDAVRTERLAIAGPSGNAAEPDLSAFLRRLFDEKQGAFPMLAGTLLGSGRGVPLDAAVVDITQSHPSTVFDGHEIKVTAVGVTHGNIPALAYRVAAGTSSIVFSGDQAGTDPGFIELARDADVLVMHLAVAAGESSPAHAAPATVGRVAREARVKRLIVSHVGPGLARDGRTLKPELDLGPALAELKKHYDGAVAVAEDLRCTAVP